MGGAEKLQRYRREREDMAEQMYEHVDREDQTEEDRMALEAARYVALFFCPHASSNELQASADLVWCHTRLQTYEGHSQVQRRTAAYARPFTRSMTDVFFSFATAFVQPPELKLGPNQLPELQEGTPMSTK